MLKVASEAETTGILVLSIGKEVETAGMVELNIGLEAETPTLLVERIGAGAGELAGMVIPLRVAQALMSSF